jgi:sec-independent protein translocase protein TatB
MIDFGFDKIALIGVVALIVIGPERLPRVARTVGHLLGKAQRYVSDVKAEVNRSIELEELKKMKTQFEDAAHDVQSSVAQELNEAQADMNKAWAGASSEHDAFPAFEPHTPTYRPPKKNWRLKRGATPQWYKKQQGVRTHAQSGAARVARFRPANSSPFRKPS